MKKTVSVIFAVLLLFSFVPSGCFGEAAVLPLFVEADAANEVEFQFAAMKVKPGSDGVVIDIENRLVYGIPLFTEDLGDYIEGGDGYTLGFENTVGFAGTGSFVKVIKSEKEIAVFKTVTAGDVNGDGVSDVLDASLAERIAAGHVDTVTTDKVFLEAAKVVADGNDINISDYSAIVNCALGEKSLNFDRLPSMGDGKAQAEFDDVIITGESFEPDPEVTVNGKVLEKGKDYTIEYSYNVAEGRGQAVITASSESLFSGTKVFTFDVASVSIKLPNYNKYMYRIGNANTVALSSLFETTGEIDSSKISVAVSNIAGNTSGVYTANSTDWGKGTLKFSGTGVAKVDINGDLSLYLEVVNGKNATTAQSATSSDIILLNNVSSSGRLAVTGNHTLYGNGFTITDTRSDTSSTTGFITVANSKLDNVEIAGQEYPETVTTGTQNQYYSPCMDIDGESRICNSHISGCSYAIKVNGGNIVMENSLAEGGTVANIAVNGGTLTLKNSMTSKSLKNSLQGLGIVVASKNAKLNIEGTLKQYNWLSSSQIPSDYSSILKSMYDNSTYSFSNGGTKYINMGVLLYNTTDGISKTEAEKMISDSTSNSYGFTEKTYLGITGTCYTEKSAGITAADLNGCVYSSAGQYYTDPATSFDYTVKNYIAKTADSNKYCYYDSSLKKVNISFDSEDNGFDWDPMILTVSKYGSQYDYTVSMNGTDYTNKNITFTESGNYEVVYRYEDENNYSFADGVLNKNTKVYEKTIAITVSVVDPQVASYNPTFTYTSGKAAKKVIVNNNTYIMPDVTATSTEIGSTTVSGQTIYYPIVTVGPTSSNGDTAYSSGKGYYFAPAFSEINIVDYDQTSGNKLYTYNSSAKTWPHGESSKDGPDDAIFGYDTGAAYSNLPFARSMNAQYYGFGSNSKGLCYTTNEIEKDNGASEHLVKYHYVGNDGVTYYYYIKYSFTAMTYSSCFAEGTNILLADGTEKKIEDITFGDKILAWDFFEGKYVEKDIALLVFHGCEEYKIANTVYSDGTVLRIIGEHGIFDYDLNKYVYITPDNCKDYIGHRFVKYSSSDDYEIVTMTDAFVTEEYTGAYSITSAGTSNAFAEGLLTVAPPDDFYNWIKTDGKLRYDTEAFNADVEQYGLYDYSVFKDYVTYDQFVDFNGAYLKIAVEKGYFTFDYIIELIGKYSEWMPV